jgi:hypothetical protein
MDFPNADTIGPAENPPNRTGNMDKLESNT